MNSCIAFELDHIPRILHAQARYKFEVNFKKITITKPNLNAKYNFKSILNRGVMAYEDAARILLPSSTLLIIRTSGKSTNHRSWHRKLILSTIHPI